MIISIFASIWAQNLWDELILKNEIKLLEKDYWKDTQFIVYSYDTTDIFFKKSNIKYVEYFPIWIKSPKNLFRNIKNFILFLYNSYKSDLIVIGWGGIFFDNEKQTTSNPLNHWKFRRFIFDLLKRKVYFFAVWLNIKNKKSYNKIKKIFSWAYKISVRDKYSLELLKSLNIDSKLLKDPVFYDNKNILYKSNILFSIKSEQFDVNKFEQIDFQDKKVALALRGGYIKDEIKSIEKIINLILGNWWQVILLPHSFHKTDYLANDEIFLKQFLKINEKITIVHNIEDVYKKYLYREFDVCLAMRLHSVILSQVYNIPFVWISYSKKTDEILDLINNFK